MTTGGSKDSSPGERSFCWRGHKSQCSTKLSCFCSCHKPPKITLNFHEVSKKAEIELNKILWELYQSSQEEDAVEQAKNDIIALFENWSKIFK